jgi:hypothetical protein
VRVSAALLGAAVAFAAVTLYALEGREVVVVRTRAPDGSTRETRTWVAEDGGSAWIEAAFEERPFFQDLLVTPEVDVVRGDGVHRYRAIPVPNPGGRVRIRALLAEKYGWADWWVGLLQDTSRSVAVRLEPVS